MRKRLPIGISDFKELMEENYYFIDKSLLIKELLDDGSKVVLLPRPRRFGKTLNLSMLRYFYEKTAEDTSQLFESLAIWQQGKAYKERQGSYPVIYLTFKDVKCHDWEGCIQKICRVLGEEYERHHQRLFDQLNRHEQVEYLAIVEQTADRSAYQDSLRKLSLYLERHYGRKTVILIDEYDTPIQEGYIHGYYSQVISFMRNMLSGALKDNSSLEQGVLTGILRVAKESIFSGLNNLRVCSLLIPEYSTHFGLLEQEVTELFHYYEIKQHLEAVKDWYNRYIFGDTTIYNPWSIINYAAQWRNGFQPYWVNTSSNDLIRQVLTTSGATVKEELEQLIRGESIQKEIQDHTVFQEIEQSSNALWNFLLFSGYLKVQSHTLVEGIHNCELLIPNKEVAVLYRRIIMSWFETSIQDKHHLMMLNALVNGDLLTFEDIFQDFVMKTFSMFDTGGEEPEKVYHAFVLGLFIRLQDRYEVRSNRESGYGRYDVMLIPKDLSRKGIVIEFKKARRNETLDQAGVAALEQIERKNYARELLALGCQDILKLGIAFQGKKVRMVAST
jgi:hypothetical protein